MKSTAKVLFAVILSGFASWYIYQAYERANGELLGTYPSDDGLYTAQIYTIRQPTLGFDYQFEVKILDANGKVVKTSSEALLALNDVFWDCDSKKCSGFQWGNEDRHYITVPPSALDRVLVMLP